MTCSGKDCKKPPTHSLMIGDTRTLKCCLHHLQVIIRTLEFSPWGFKGWSELRVLRSPIDAKHYFIRELIADFPNEPTFVKTVIDSLPNAVFVNEW